MQNPSPPNSLPTTSAATSSTLSWKKAAWIIFAAVFLGAGLSAAGTIWWVKHHLYANRMEPVRLSVDEQKTLDAKLDTLGAPPAPEQEDESKATVQTDDRTLWISAKELNAFLAKQGLGETFRVSLAKDMLDVTMIAPVPADSGVPLLAGTTLRVKMSMILALDDAGARRCIIQDVRVGGVPLPNAWLGDIKGINWVGESLDEDPALQRFFAGIKEAEILAEGIRVVLNE